MNPSAVSASGLPDPGSTGPGGCTYADDGATCAAASAGGGGGGGLGGGGAGGAGGVTPVVATRAIVSPVAEAPPVAPAMVVAEDDRARVANGRGATTAASLSVRSDGQTGRRVSVPYGKPVVIVGRLTGRAGAPIAAAAVSVVSVNGRTTAAQPPVVTDADGAFRAVIAPGPSRTIRFSYRAYADDAQDADTAELEIGVRAVAHLRAAPRALHNGDAVRFRGSVAGAPVGARKVVEMQVFQDGRWLTFATTRLRGGHFAYRYRFTRTNRTTRYVFRTVVRTDAGWPYETGSSNRVAVEVRP